MVLVTVTIDGSEYRISTEELALEHAWRFGVISFGPVHFSTATTHGGYAAVNYGKIIIDPSVFAWAGVSSPPTTMVVTAQYTATTEAAATELFSGVAHLASFSRDQVEYDLYPPSYSEEITSGTAYDSSLNYVLETILTSITGIDSVDTTLARDPSPDVDHTTTSDQLAINLASDIAAFYGHLFYVTAGVAYIVDMQENNGTATLTEFDIFADPGPRYWTNPPVAIARAGDYLYASAYPYGAETSVTAYSTVQADVEGELENIVTIENSMRASIAIPLGTSLPSIGQKYQWVDTSLAFDVEFYIRARVIRYDFNEDQITIEGDGGYVEDLGEKLITEDGFALITEDGSVLLV